MTHFDLDAKQLTDRIQRLLERFERTSGEHQRDESFAALDSTSYTLVAKLLSPFGNGVTTEEVGSTAELQQRVNHWIGVQRQLGQLAAVRLVITPDIGEMEGEDES